MAGGSDGLRRDLGGVRLARRLPKRSQLLLDIAADRPVDPNRSITESELAGAAGHGLLGLMATSDHPGMSESARAAFARLVARQQAMERVLRPVLERLAGAEIPATVVKGPALARWGYRRPEHRTYNDIDLVVPAQRMAETLDVLADIEQTVAIPAKTPKADKRNILMADASGVRFTLDLHWDLFSYTQLRQCARRAADEGWEQATWRPDHPLGPMWQLPTPMLVAFLATHAVLDHRFRLILFRDLAEIAASGTIDWAEVIEWCDRHSLRSITYLAFLLASMWVEAEIPSGILKALRRRSLPVRAVEKVAPKVDPVTFNGHRPHPLNLAVVLVHDWRFRRIELAATAPFAFPEWLRRVEPSAAKYRHKSNPTKQVLHILPLDLARGAQIYAREVRDALDSQLVEHRTLTLFRSESASVDADFGLESRVGFGRRLGFSPPTLWRLWQHLRQTTPDVIVTHGGEGLKYAAVAKPAGTRLVYYKIGASDDLLRYPVRRTIYGWLTRTADLVAGVSVEMVQEAIRLHGIPQSEVIYIPNGRDPLMFLPPPARRASGRVRIVSVGHLIPLKRPEWLVRAIALLRERGIDCEGVWVGDGPLLRQLADHTGEWMRFVGRRSDVGALLSAADIFCMSSTTEGMPGVLIEAGMSGLAAVTTAVAGASTVIKNGVTGYIVGVDDFDEFVGRIGELAVNESLRRVMGEAARKRCVDSFSITTCASLWEHELAKLLEGGEAR